MIFLQVTPQIGQSLIEQWGLVGILIVGFGAVVYKLYAMYNEERKTNKEVSGKVVELMTRISDKLPGLDKVSQLERNQMDILKELATLKSEGRAMAAAIGKMKK